MRIYHLRNQRIWFTTESCYMLLKLPRFGHLRVLLLNEKLQKHRFLVAQYQEYLNRSENC